MSASHDDLRDRLRAFLDYADCQRLRGNEHAAREAEVDATVLLMEMAVRCVELDR